MDTFHGVRIPSSQTLKKYGITLPEWKSMLKLQGFRCFICQRVPPSGRLCIDHFHVKSWRRMKPEQRRIYVRGLICIYDNYRLVNKSMTLTKAKRIVEYLQRYEDKIKE